MGTMHEHPFDGVTADQLREGGSMKWSRFPDAIGAFVAEMDFGIAPPISSALHAAVDRAVTGYLPSRLVADLAGATRAWYQDSYGWAVPASQIHPVPDVISVLELTIEQYTPTGSKVIVPTPAYMPFLSVPPSLGREVVQVPSIPVAGRWQMDLAGIADAFDDGGHLLLLCNPHNPLGTVFVREELLAVCDLVTERGGRVFADEVHAPIVYGGAVHIPYASVSLAAAAHTITAASASKAWNLAGLKCAQAILSNPDDELRWQQLGHRAGRGAANFGVIANTVAYTSGRPWLAGVVQYLDGNRRLLGELVDERLPGVRYTAPEGSYIAWLDFRDYGIAGDLGEFFRARANVALTDGAACGETGAGFARFVFALPRPLLREAVERLREALPDPPTRESVR